MRISGYMYEFQDLTPISGHFRTNFKISGISGQRPGLNCGQQVNCKHTHLAWKANMLNFIQNLIIND